MLDFKDKRVCFVGGCPNIMAKRLGELIDSYDYVIRPNGSFPVIDKYVDDYGSKTTHWSINNQYKRYIARHKICMPIGVTPIYKSSLSEIFALYSMVQGLLMGPAIWAYVLEQGCKELYITGIDFMTSKSREYKPFDYPEYYPEYLPLEIQEEGNKVKSKNCNGHSIEQNNELIKQLFDRYPNFYTDDFIREILK